jgi:hypothetical protein
MEVICIVGTTPGLVTATVSHCGAVRQIPMEVARHAAGGWRARLAGGAWGVRCHAAATAVLLEAGEAFSECVPEPVTHLSDPAKLAAD